MRAVKEGHVAMPGYLWSGEEFTNLGHLLHNLRRQKNLQLKFARSPLVLLPEEVLFGEVDQVDHRLRSDEEMFVQHFNLKHHKNNLLTLLKSEWSSDVVVNSDFVREATRKITCATKASDKYCYSHRCCSTLRTWCASYYRRGRPWSWLTTPAGKKRVTLF